MLHVLQIFAYLKSHLNSRLVLDLVTKDWLDREWMSVDWLEFYLDAMETLPLNALEPQGVLIQMNVFMDAAHVTNLVTRHSIMGILIFLIGALVKWYYKCQNTIESSTFGLEFVVVKITVEMVEGLRYKLHMMGILLDGLANGFCNNNSVVTNASNPALMLKKKHNSTMYHKVRESTAAGTIRFTYEPGKLNLADMLTKILPAKKLKECVQCCLF